MKTSAKTGKVLFAIGFGVCILSTGITSVEYFLMGSLNFAWRGVTPAVLLMIFGNNIVQRANAAESAPVKLPAYAIAAVIIILIALALSVAFMALALMHKVRP